MVDYKLVRQAFTRAFIVLVFALLLYLYSRGDPMIRDVPGLFWYTLAFGIVGLAAGFAVISRNYAPVYGMCSCLLLGTAASMQQVLRDGETAVCFLFAAGFLLITGATFMEWLRQIDRRIETLKKRAAAMQSSP